MLVQDSHRVIPDTILPVDINYMLVDKGTMTGTTGPMCWLGELDIRVGNVLKIVQDCPQHDTDKPLSMMGKGNNCCGNRIRY